ncbi:hypothetical protein H8959_011357 [Pygathrix nigripes]
MGGVYREDTSVGASNHPVSSCSAHTDRDPGKPLEGLQVAGQEKPARRSLPSDAEAPNMSRGGRNAWEQLSRAPATSLLRTPVESALSASRPIPESLALGPLTVS